MLMVLFSCLELWISILVQVFILLVHSCVSSCLKWQAGEKHSDSNVMLEPVFNNIANRIIYTTCTQKLMSECNTIYKLGQYMYISWKSSSNLALTQHLWPPHSRPGGPTEEYTVITITSSIYVVVMETHHWWALFLLKLPHF